MREIRITQRGCPRDRGPLSPMSQQSCDGTLQVSGHLPIGEKEMIASIPHTMRELHSRVNDGLHVRLLWAEDDGRLAVAVTDIRTSDAFCIELRDGENAMEVFHHPYAYVTDRAAV